MIPLSPTILGAIGAGIVILGLGAAVKVQSARLESTKAEYAGFVAQVKAAGDAQEAASKVKDEQNKLAKEKSDAQNAKSRAALIVALNSLRHASSSGGGLSAPTPSATSPARTCFDPAKLDSALRNLDQGILGIVEIGSGAVADLDSAKAWAQSRP